MVPNWSKLVAYKTRKDKSFEQLCYQLASRQFGWLTSVDDSGGGDGVEFYRNIEDGWEWGWQAKYYEGSTIRLTQSRKVKIKGSLSRTLEVHPALCKWFLCLPMVLTRAEREWVEIELVKEIPTGRSVEIEVWDEDVIHEFLNRPTFLGLKNAFFNELELSHSWFLKRFDILSVIVEMKFDADLYTEALAPDPVATVIT